MRWHRGSFFRSVTLIVVVVRFDGALRYPTDPGFPTPSSQLGRLAACSATISVVFKQQGKNDTLCPSSDSIFAVGGQRLTADTISSSGEAEYDGLIFSLEGLHKFLPALQETDHVEGIVIQGDCKTIIQQMSGLARPRKLGQRYAKAQMFMQNLQRETGQLATFECIPREDNVLCDRVAAQIMLEQEQTAYSMACKKLDDLWVFAESQNASGFDSELLFSNFNSLLATPGSSLIPLSKRPRFYQALAAIAMRTECYAVLLLVGECLESEIRSAWQSSAPPILGSCMVSSVATQKRITFNSAKDQWLAEAIHYQIRALKSVGSICEAETRWRKHQRLLRRIPDGMDALDEYEQRSLPREFLLETRTNRGLDEHVATFTSSWFEHARIDEQWRASRAYWHII